MHCHVHHKHSIPFRLEAAEDRYSNRESRPEDVDAIRELKKLVSQQEFMLKEAIVSYITTGAAAGLREWLTPLMHTALWLMCSGISCMLLACACGCVV